MGVCTYNTNLIHKFEMFRVIYCVNHFQSKYSTYYTTNKEIKIDAREEKNAILSGSSADLFSHGCQQKPKGFVGGK